MRGVPGSGKSFLAKLIKDKIQEIGRFATLKKIDIPFINTLYLFRSARILSIDDYFMTEQLRYEYEPEMERMYTEYLLKSFKKTLFDNLFDYVIVDCQNTTVKDLDDFYTTATTHMFTVRNQNNNCIQDNNLIFKFTAIYMWTAIGFGQMFEK